MCYTHINLKHNKVYNPYVCDLKTNISKIPSYKWKSRIFLVPRKPCVLFLQHILLFPAGGVGCNPGYTWESPEGLLNHTDANPGDTLEWGRTHIKWYNMIWYARIWSDIWYDIVSDVINLDFNKQHTAKGKCHWTKEFFWNFNLLAWRSC